MTIHMDVIKMRSTFIQNYEKNLVETAVDKAIKDAMEVIRTKGNGTAHEIDENESIRQGILEKTGGIFVKYEAFFALYIFLILVIAINDKRL